MTSPEAKLAVDPGVGNPGGDVALDRIVWVMGISSGAGFKPAVGDDEGEDALLGAGTGGCFDGELGVAATEASDPGGREPLPVSWVVAPSGLETFIAG